MIEFVQGLGAGIIAWFITGIDDFLVILVYMKIRSSLLNTFSVIIGTVAAVSLMIAICVSLDLAAEKTIGKMGNLRIVGIIPVVLGTYGLIRWLRGTREEVSKLNRWIEASGIAVASFLTYLSNSVDDIIVNTSFLQSDLFFTFSQRWWGFLFGIELGALITCGFAYLLLILGDEIQGRLKESSVLHQVSRYLPAAIDISIIIAGLMVLLNKFPTLE